jgi:general secretion pathway protein I
VRRGFTLLEMIVATLIMGIAIVGMLSGLAGVTRNASRLFERDRAVQLARAKMNELIADRDLPRGQVIGGEFAPAEASGVEAGWRARIVVFEKPAIGGLGAMLMDRIELEIWWMAGQQRRTFTLDGYRTRFALPADYGTEPPPQ